MIESIGLYFNSSGDLVKVMIWEGEGGSVHRNTILEKKFLDRFHKEIVLRNNQREGTLAAQGALFVAQEEK